MRTRITLIVALLSMLVAGTLTAGELSEPAASAQLKPRLPMEISRVTGADKSSCVWGVCATDLGIAYTRPDGTYGYIFGDTFASPMPGGPGWRSPTILVSPTNPHMGEIQFTGALGKLDPRRGIVVTQNGYRSDGEFSAIPNDVVVLPDGRQILSVMSIRQWLGPEASPTGEGSWTTNGNVLAVSTNDGNWFERTGAKQWHNTNGNSPFQMMSLQYAHGYVYTLSVRAGRVDGPMMLQRAPWQQAADPSAYRCWNGTNWGGECKPLTTGRFGEPSLRVLSDGTWAMTYLNTAKHAIVSRVASRPEGPWSNETIQFPDRYLDSMYGGFLHPASRRDDPILMVSCWQANRYDVSQIRTHVSLGTPPSS